MTLGQKIKKLRMEKNLTQKELADQVYVTFQTVSKWEKDENEPDVATLRELSRLFDCSLDYLLKEDEEVKKAEIVESTPATEPTELVTKTIIIHQKEKHVCARCKKDIEDENDLEIDHVCVRNAGRGHSAEYRDDYYHKECLKLTQQEREAKAKEEKRLKGIRAKKLSFGWGIAGGIVAFSVMLGVFLAVPACKEIIHPALAVLYSVLIGYGIFAALYCIISGSYISDVFMEVAGWSIKMPGLIFTWDLDGIMWLIAMKILFLILGAMLTGLVLALAVSLSALLGSISFPFVLIHNINTQYGDAL